MAKVRRTKIPMPAKMPAPSKPSKTSSKTRSRPQSCPVNAGPTPAFMFARVLAAWRDPGHLKLRPRAGLIALHRPRISKDGTHDEHPPARDEMRQVVRQALD